MSYLHIESVVATVYASIHGIYTYMRLGLKAALSFLRFFFKHRKRVYAYFTYVTRVHRCLMFLYVLFHLMSTNERTKSALNS